MAPRRRRRGVIARISHGNGFRGVCSYLLREGREDDLGWEAYRLDTNMSGHNARQLAHEFGMYRQINGRVENPVFHASLRLPNGESLTDEQWRAVASMYLQQMGYTNTAYVVIKHPENHIHVVASRIRFDGTRVQTWQERWTSMGAMHEIERAYDLSRPRTRPSKEHPSRLVRESPVEQRMAAQLGERPVKVELARRIDMALERSDGSREDFTRALAEAGVQVRWSAGKDGTVRGASFELSEYSGQQQARWKGSKIGSLYRWQELGARLEEHAQAHAIRQEQAAEKAAEPEREVAEAERPPAARTDADPCLRGGGAAAVAGGRLSGRAGRGLGCRHRARTCPPRAGYGRAEQRRGSGASGIHRALARWLGPALEGHGGRPAAGPRPSTAAGPGVETGANRHGESERAGL